jgi:hypothetical protein
MDSTDEDEIDEDEIRRRFSRWLEKQRKQSSKTYFSFSLIFVINIIEKIFKCLTNSEILFCFIICIRTVGPRKQFNARQ